MSSVAASSGLMSPVMSSLCIHESGDVASEARRFRFFAVGVAGACSVSSSDTVAFLAEFRNEYLGSISTFEAGVETCAFRGVRVLCGVATTTWIRQLRRSGSCALRGGVGSVSSSSLGFKGLRGVSEGLRFSSRMFVRGF